MMEGGDSKLCPSSGAIVQLKILNQLGTGNIQTHSAAATDKTLISYQVHNNGVFIPPMGGETSSAE